MKKALFIDRDGTIILEPEDYQIDAFEKLQFFPKAIQNLAKLRKDTDFEFVMVSNQDGLGTDSFPENTFWPTHNLILDILNSEGVTFDAMHIDPTLPEENADTRKPGTGMLKEYMTGEYDLANSFVLGDRPTDVQLAKNLGAQSILLSEEAVEGATLVSMDWDEIAEFISKGSREASVKRKTKETDIDITINLDGSGKSDIDTGLKFFDHMLEQISRHSMSNLSIKVIGDLEVDEHHTIEDTAIALGEAIAQAMGDKRGMERYGFALPMDDCLAQVTVDFGGRSWVEWDAEFKREKVGDMPTEMFFHFFKSLCDGAKLNMNIKAEGGIEHHKIEAIFKAFARALKMAKRQDKSGVLPSTKGML